MRLQTPSVITESGHLKLHRFRARGKAWKDSCYSSSWVTLSSHNNLHQATSRSCPLSYHQLCLFFYWRTLEDCIISKHRLGEELKTFYVERWLWLRSWWGKECLWRSRVAIFIIKKRSHHRWSSLPALRVDGRVDLSNIGFSLEENIYFSRLMNIIII